MIRIASITAFSLFVLPLQACISPSGQEEEGETLFQNLSAEVAGIELVSVAEDLDDPWGMDFLPDGSLLVTEKSGRLLHIAMPGGEQKEVQGVPVSREIGQGGLMDVLVQNEPGEKPWIYLSYAVEKDETYSTRIARARWSAGRLEDFTILFTAMPYYPTKRHFGSRLVIVDDYLYFTVGDRGNRDYAQDLSRHNGKVMRLHRDGSVPDDNPFVATVDARPEIWTFGHRNLQGLALHPDGKTLWSVEHGPRGGDEINVLRRGANYGWPIITYGEEYAGGKIGEGTHREGMEQPLKYYVPSIATCGAAFYSSERYPDWKDSFLVTALRGTHLNKIDLAGAGLGREQRLFGDQQKRFRDVQQGPDGYVYVLAGGDSLLKLVPAE